MGNWLTRGGGEPYPTFAQVLRRCAASGGCNLVGALHHLSQRGRQTLRRHPAIARAVVLLDGLWLRDLFASDRYIVHSEMGKDQTLEFIEV